jgi:hypothetical protein
MRWESRQSPLHFEDPILDLADRDGSDPAAGRHPMRRETPAAASRSVRPTTWALARGMGETRALTLINNGGRCHVRHIQQKSSCRFVRGLVSLDV